MGFKTEFNWTLKLSPEQGLDEENLEVGEEHSFEKSDYRTYPLDIPIDLVNHKWEVVGKAIVIETTLKNNKTTGRYRMIKIYPAEKREILRKDPHEKQ